MAYISPDSDIVLIKNCILQKSSVGETDTLYFADESAQSGYFNGIPDINSENPASSYGNTRKIEYNNATYQNISQGVMRIGKTMKELYGCNYMYFTNSGEYTNDNNQPVYFYEKKRYYCFIDHLKYINNYCTEVYYSLDYLQTFMFDFTEQTCFIDRMTTDDDEIGKYVLDEGLDLGSELKVLKVDEAYFTTWAYFVLFGYTDNLPKKRVKLNNTTGSITYLKGVFTDFNYTTNMAEYFNEFVFSVPNGLLNNNLPIFVEICTGVKQYPVIDGSTNPPIIDTNNITYITFGVTADSWKVFGKIFTGRGICDRNGDYNSENATTDYERLIHGVYSATLCPTAFTNLGTGGATEYSVTDDNFIDGKAPGTDTGDDCLQTIDGYAPKNKKLFTYPYVYLLACSSEGETQTYRFEWFNIHGEENNYSYYQFELSACAVPTPICCMSPKNYYLGDGDYDKTSGIVISNFQQIPLFTDSYKEYVAKNRYRENMAMTNAVLSGVNNVVSPIATSAMTGSLALATPTAVTSVYSSMKSFASAATNVYQQIFEKTKRNEIAKMNPPGLIGQIGTPDLKVYLNKFGYYLLTMGIDATHAKNIDDYFTRYGYKIAHNAVPSRNNRGKRKIFTFIKTIDCNIKANAKMRQDDIVAIQAIYNNGVRYWHGKEDNKRVYKDYSKDNSIVTTQSNNNNNSLGNT